MKILLLGGTVYKAALQELGHRVSVFLPQHCYEDGRQVRRYSLENALVRAGFKPDLVLVELFGARPFVQGLVDCPYPLAAYCYDSSFNHFWARHYFKLFDAIFVDFKNSVGRLAAEGLEAHWLPYAIHAPDFGPFDLPKRWDIAFVGVTEKRPRRQALIETLREHFDVHVEGALQGENRLKHREMAEVYAQARLVVNEYLFDGVNFRVFEAMGAGTMLLTEYTENGLFDLFEERRHLVTFTPETLLEKVRYYLERNTERERIAKAGFEEVMARHTRRHRAETLLTVVEGIAEGKLARDRVLRIEQQARTFYHFGARWPEHRKELFARTEAALRDAVRAKPRKPGLHAVYGRFHGMQGDRETGLKALRLATRLRKEDPLVRFHLGHLLLALEQAAEAAETFQDGVELLKELGPSVTRPVLLQLKRAKFDAETWYRMGRLFEAWGRSVEPNDDGRTDRLFPETASHYYLMAYRGEEHQKALVALGDVYTAAGMASQAMDCYLTALDHQPDSPELLEKAGRTAVKVFRLREGVALLEGARRLRE